MFSLSSAESPKESHGSLNRSSGVFLLNDDAKIRLFSDTTKFRVAIRADFQQLLILNSVNKTNSYFSKKENIVLLREKLWVLFWNNHNNSYHSFSNHFPKSYSKTNYRYNIIILYYYIISIVKRINYSIFSIECPLENCDNCYCDSLFWLASDVPRIRMKKKIVKLFLIIYSGSWYF